MSQKSSSQPRCEGCYFASGYDPDWTFPSTTGAIGRSAPVRLLGGHRAKRYDKFRKHLAPGSPARGEEVLQLVRDLRREALRVALRGRPLGDRRVDAGTSEWWVMEADPSSDLHEETRRYFGSYRLTARLFTCAGATTRSDRRQWFCACESSTPCRLAHKDRPSDLVLRTVFPPTFGPGLASQVRKSMVVRRVNFPDEGAARKWIISSRLKQLSYQVLVGSHETLVPWFSLYADYWYLDVAIGDADLFLRVRVTLTKNSGQREALLRMAEEAGAERGDLLANPRKVFNSKPLRHMLRRFAAAHRVVPYADPESPQFSFVGLQPSGCRCGCEPWEPSIA